MAIQNFSINLMDMKSLICSLTLLPLSLFAHPGHPGVENHGDLTHVLLGLAFALPAAMLLAGIRIRARRKAHIKVTKQD